MKRMKKRPCAMDVAMGKTDVEHHLDFGGFFWIRSLIFHLPRRDWKGLKCVEFFFVKVVETQKKVAGGKKPSVFDHLQFHSKLVQVLRWRDGKKPNLAGSF